MTCEWFQIRVDLFDLIGVDLFDLIGVGIMGLIVLAIFAYFIWVSMRSKRL